jgi:hypothetical protein
MLRPVAFAEGGKRSVWVPAPLDPIAHLSTVPPAWTHTFPLGQITQTRNPDGSITNTTGPGFHAACCGKVTRSLLTVNNSLYVSTIGVGSNYGGSVGRWFNEFAGPRTFRALDQQLKQAGNR